MTTYGLYAISGLWVLSAYGCSCVSLTGVKFICGRSLCDTLLSIGGCAMEVCRRGACGDIWRELDYRRLLISLCL